MSTVAFFCRHAEKAGGSRNPPLTAEGRAAADAGGAWLAAQGVNLRGVLHTDTRRTAETAARVVAAAGARPAVVAVGAIPRTRNGLGPALDALVAEAGGAVLLVGHGNHQRRVEADYGGAAFDVPEGHRGAIFRLERGPAGWVCTGAFSGAPARGG